MTKRLLGSLLISICVSVVVSCSTNDSSKKPDSTPPISKSSDTPTIKAIDGPSVATTKPVDLPGIHNVVAYSDGIYSGGVPEGEEGFATLRAMGIKTILSVDGGQPDTELASKYGFRYVHLPIGYDGMDKQRTLEIARVIRDLPQPIYIHCHHGKHRSAGATGAALVTLGKLTTEQAVARMRVSGTSPNYPGLYQCTNVALVATNEELDKVSNEFPQHWKTSGFVEAMVEIDDANEHLKLIEKSGWKAPKDHPDLVPAAEAGRLADHFRNLNDDEYVTAQGDEFAKWLMEDSRKVSQLEEALVAANVPPEKLSEYFAVVNKSCNDCHTKYRNVPGK